MIVEENLIDLVVLVLGFEVVNDDVRKLGFKNGG